VSRPVFPHSDARITADDGDTLRFCSTCALMLVTILPGALFANQWLTLKLALLVVYVAAGTMALKRARTPRARTLFFIAALAVYAIMLGIARAHHPLGWLLS